MNGAKVKKVLLLQFWTTRISPPVRR